MKKIRLRETLTKIIAVSDIYLRSKVPEDMYATLQQFAFIRRCERMQQVHDFNLLPDPVLLQVLERKYGDSLSNEDLHGIKKKKKRRRGLTTTGMSQVVVPGLKLMESQGGTTGLDISGSVARNENSVLEDALTKTVVSGRTSKVSPSPV